MKTIQGTGVSAGIAIGRISVLKEKETVVRQEVKDTVAEIERFRGAQSQAVAQLDALRTSTAADLGEDKAQLFDAHKLMVQDPGYVDNVERMITDEGVNAEYAVYATGEKFAEMFSRMDNEYMKSRAADVRDVSERLIAALTGESEGTGKKTENQGPRIIMAEDLTPSQTAQLDRTTIMALVTSKGSRNAHTAILARTMALPAVIGIGDSFDERDDGKQAVVDGDEGVVIVDPDETTLREYQEKQRRYSEHQRLLQELKGKPTQTSKGQRIKLYANIGRPSDVDDVLANDAEGIGLFRSEFLYLDSQDYPTEEFQFNAYREVAQRMEGKNVVIRTLDIGADKQVGYFGLEHEANPALGYRAIRICLTRPEIFKVQLRAILRASAFGNISIMLPMITSVNEVHDAKAIIEAVKAQLRSEHVDFDERIKVGIMIETPASVIMAPELAREVDFFSIGTNDLTQYTLACDRQNPNLSRFADPHSPAVLRMIAMTAKAAHDAGIWCGICGELGADRELTQTFVDDGIDELSVTPSSVLPVREIVREH